MGAPFLLIALLAGCTLAPPMGPLPPPRDPIAGTRSSADPILLTLFSDFGCGTCGDAFRLTQELKAHYREDIRVVYRDYITEGINPGAYRAALAGRCVAEQGKFEAYAALVFAGALDWKTVEEQRFTEYVAQAQADMSKYAECRATKRPAEAIANDVEDAKLLDVRKTPAIFLGGDEVSAKEFDAATWIARIDAARVSSRR